jgi:hypothetical protein
LFQFTNTDGGVASNFISKFQVLNASNSKHKLSIEKFLTKSEEAFFDKISYRVPLALGPCGVIWFGELFPALITLDHPV